MTENIEYQISFHDANALFWAAIWLLYFDISVDLNWLRSFFCILVPFTTKLVCYIMNSMSMPSFCFDMIESNYDTWSFDYNYHSFDHIIPTVLISTNIPYIPDSSVQVVLQNNISLMKPQRLIWNVNDQLASWALIAPCSVSWYLKG